jgi:hypothetical protein
MKIDIVQDAKSAVGNYQPVIISDGNIDFFDISDSECVEVRANQVIDQFSSQNVESNLLSILKKVRIGGKVVLSGIDCNILSRQLISGQIDENTFSNIVSACNSMSSLKKISRAVKLSGFTVESQKINGSVYEIVAKRG